MRRRPPWTRPRRPATRFGPCPAPETVEEQRGRCAGLDRELSELRTVQEAAQEAVAALQRGDAAHTAGSALAPGDSCPVCTRPVPSDFTPPSPLDSRALRRAKG